MRRRLLTVLGGVLLASCLLPAPSRAQVVVGVGVGFYPPPAFIATAPPVYYQSRPVYYWGNRWYYRVGPAWHYYGVEPAYLHGWRTSHVYVRHYYEPHRHW
jgi:hypothetical protein